MANLHLNVLKQKKNLNNIPRIRKLNFGPKKVIAKKIKIIV